MAPKNKVRRHGLLEVSIEASLSFSLAAFDPLWIRDQPMFYMCYGHVEVWCSKLSIETSGPAPELLGRHSLRLEIEELFIYQN